MSLLKARIRTTEAARTTGSDDSLQCAASGCHRPWTIRTEGGRTCSFHYGVEPRQWPAITAALAEHSWLCDFITDLMRDMRLHADREWRHYASQFWGDERDMRPADFESRERYLYRMHFELLYRIGARSTRPEPSAPVKSVRRFGPAEGTRDAGEVLREMVQ